MSHYLKMGRQSFAQQFSKKRTRAYKQFSQAAVVPIIEATAKLVAFFISPKESAGMFA